MRFLPLGTELRTHELCARIDIKTRTDSAKRLALAVQSIDARPSSRISRGSRVTCHWWLATMFAGPKLPDWPAMPVGRCWNLLNSLTRFAVASWQRAHSPCTLA